jgi:hypothetical protein
MGWYPLILLFGLFTNCGCLVGSTIIFAKVVFCIIGAEIGSFGLGYIHHYLHPEHNKDIPQESLQIRFPSILRIIIKILFKSLI